MATLGDLAQVAALFAGVHQQRKDAKRTRREELAFRNAQQEIARQQLAYQQKKLEADAEQEKAEAKRRAQIARNRQLGLTFNPLLQMGRTAQEQADLSQTPGLLEALRADQADIANLQAMGEDAPWETFRPRFYGGQGLVPPPAGGGFADVGRGSQAPPVGAPSEGLGVEWGPLGPPVGVSAMAPPPPAAASPASPAAATAAPSWMTAPLPLPAKTAAQIRASDAAAGLATERKDDLAATRNPRIAKLTAETALALANGDFRRVQMLTEELRQETERTKPALNRAITKNISDLPTSREKGRQVQQEGIRTRAKTAAEDREARLQEGAANRASRERIAERVSGMKVDPLRKMAYGQAFDMLLNRSTNPATGETTWQYEEPERQQARATLQRMAREDGLDLSELIGGTAGSPSPSVPSAPASSTGGAVAPTDGQVQMIAKLSAQEYDREFRAASAHLKAQMRAARAEAVRRGLIKKGR